MSRPRKNAANFTLGTGSQQYHHYTVPKSRSENFIDYMRSTGYELPRNFSPAHCDYLFQDTELFDCVKFLMGRFKRSVGEEELKRFQNLLDNNQVLSKSELNVARSVEKERILEAQNSMKIVAEQKDSLAAEIDETRRRIEQWKQVKSLHRRGQELQKEEALRERCENEVRKKRIQAVRQELQQKRQLMLDDLRSTREVLLQAVSQKTSDSQMQNRHNWLSSTLDCVSIASEDSFFAILRTTAENYGSGLVGKSETFDPFEVERCALECAANVKDIERLRALIVYEFERSVRMKAGLEKYRQLAESLDSLVETANRIASQPPQIQARIIGDYEKRYKELKEKTAAIKKSKILELCQGKLSELNSQVKIVQNSKAMAKTKENQFFGLVSKMLLNQRARLEMVQRLMNRRNTRITEVMNSMTQFHRQLQQLLQNGSSHSSRVIDLNPHLHEMLIKKCNFPPSAFCSSEATWKALVNVDQAEDVENIRRTVSDEQKLKTQQLRLEESVETATKHWLYLHSRFNDTGTAASLQTLIQRNQQIKAEMSTYPEKRENLIKDAIDWKRSKLEEVNAFLEGC